MRQNRTGLNQISARYLEAALKGDVARAIQVVEEGRRDGWATLILYQDVVTAVGIEIGLRWHRGEIDTAHEHLVTQVNLKLLEKLRRDFQPARHRGVRVVVACVQGNSHSLGARLVADFLYFDGWDVDFLGEDNPSKDLAQFAQRRKAKLVALSLALEQQLPVAAQAVVELRSLEPAPYVIIGGPLAADQPEIVAEIPCDGTATDALGSVREVHRLLLPEPTKLELEDYLQELGMKVQSLRQEKGWSQERLAQAAGLDRTYISAVENGRQNLTLGALVKLAHGLEVPPEELLAGPRPDGGNTLRPDTGPE